MLKTEVIPGRYAQSCDLDNPYTIKIRGNVNEGGLFAGVVVNSPKENNRTIGFTDVHHVSHFNLLPESYDPNTDEPNANIAGLKEVNKHTAGPWYAVKYGSGYELRFGDVLEPDINLLDVDACWQAGRNAILAAAAPDMLKALQMAEKKLGGLSDMKYAPLYEAIKSAINKATSPLQPTSHELR